MIISFIQTKGGTGKTTLAKCLAYSKTFKKEFGSVCLIELDPQGTISAWHKNRQESGLSDGNVTFADLSRVNHKEIQKQLVGLAEVSDTMILDVPGESVGKFATRLAASLSDIVLIPMRSSTNDEQSFIDNIYPVITEVIRSDSTKQKTFYIIPTFVHPQTKLERIINYFKEIVPENVGYLDIFLPARSVYENFSREGMTLDDYAMSVKSNSRLYRQANKAVDDIENIAGKVLNLRNTG